MRSKQDRRDSNLFPCPRCDGTGTLVYGATERRCPDCFGHGVDFEAKCQADEFRDFEKLHQKAAK
jgi:DnaJ-class molecular chaperone